MTLSDEWLEAHADRLNEMAELIEKNGQQTLANIIGALMFSDEEWRGIVDGTADYVILNLDVQQRLSAVGIQTNIVK